jgi:hypothetical protein
LAGNRLKTIKSWDEVPEFKSEREEHEFWGSHSLSEEMLENFHPPAEGELPPPRPKTKPRPRKGSVSVRMENDLVNRLKTLAAVKGIGYQSLLQQFVADRVYEEEKCEGILK